MRRAPDRETGGGPRRAPRLGPVLALALGLVGCAVGPSAEAPPAAVLGYWASADTVRYAAPGGDGPATTTTYQHLWIGDTLSVSFSVYEAGDGVEGIEWRVGHRLSDGQMALATGETVRLRVDGDRLVAEADAPDAVPVTYRRAGPLAVPAALVGTWRGWVADGAGIAVPVVFAVDADGAATVGGEPRRVRVVGDVLLVEHDVVMDAPSRPTFFRGSRFVLDGDRLRALGDPPVAFERVR